MPPEEHVPKEPLGSSEQAVDGWEYAQLPAFGTGSLPEKSDQDPCNGVVVVRMSPSLAPGNTAGRRDWWSPV